MSKYKIVQTEYRNTASLQAALTDVIGEGLVEVARDVKIPSLPLYGYHGDQRSQRASIRIPRDQVNHFSRGASNDVGFAWDGRCFQAIVSEYDQVNLGSREMMRQVAQRYAVHEVRRQAKVKGYTVRELAQPDGTIRVTLTHR